MGPTSALLLVVAVVATAVAVVADSAPPPADSAQDAAARCAAAIVSISPCLPHVTADEAPLAAPSDACCVAFLRAMSPSGGGGGEGCLCHLLRDPLLLGFPVDAARLGALLPACAAGNSFAAATVEASTIFADACRELKTLPEMHVTPQSTTTPAAAVPELVSVPLDKVPSGAPSASSGAEASRLSNVLLAALILAAAGTAIAVHL